MTTHASQRRRAFFPRAAFAAWLLAGYGFAQTAPSAPTAAEIAQHDANKNGRLDPEEFAALNAARAKAGQPAAEETLVLNPFEVKADVDNSYGALQSNSLTAFRIDLEKMPATAQVFTATFMDDIAATNIQEMLANYTGTVGADPNNTGAVINNMPGDRDGSGGGLGIRGLASGPPKRDGMTGLRTNFRSALGYNDNFSTERVELISGPQSLLYGAVGGGGVINQVSKRANFRQNRGQLQTRFDQFGSKRGMLDYNVGLDKIALRVVGVASQGRNLRYNLGNDYYGFYTQGAIKLLPQTTVRLFYERQANWGNVAFNPGSGDLNNFLPVGDPRRGQDVRYLALTNQLADLSGTGPGKIWAGPVDYRHISSFGAWWSSERIEGQYYGMRVESTLPWGFAAQITGIYSETQDDRITVGKNLVPGAGLTGAGANPFLGAAVRVSPGDNWQSDRTRGVRANLVREDAITAWNLRARSQTMLGFEYNHQGPAFGSSGIDRMYYQADADWNVIVNPAVALDYGRTPLANIYFPVSGGIPLRPVFRPGDRKITYNGVNYVLEPRIRQDPARVSPANPFGLVPNNPSTANPNAFSGNWNRGGETHARLVNFANYTEWFDGKLTTILGASMNRFTTLNAGPTNVTYLPPRSYWGYQYGANYAILPWLRAYATLSTSAQAAGTTKDFYGNPLKVPKAESPAPEVGIKVNTPDGRYSAQLSYNFTTKVTNETRNAGVDFFNAVNPAGLNGRHNGGDQWINLDRKSTSAELVVTAAPTRNWRMRMSTVWLGGEVTSTVKYTTLYNDQFRVSNGAATYANGQPIFVNPTTGAPVASGAAGAVPLTIALMNTPASPLYAAPNSDSGSITGAALRTALSSSNPLAAANGGPSATGVTGLPLSAIQYAYTSPANGEIVVMSEGDKNTGINEYTFNFTNNYTFAEGALKGFGVFTSMRTYYKNRAYYTSYFPTGTTNALRATRMLYRLPSATVFDLGLSYKFRPKGSLQRYSFSTQLNVNNALNHYKVWVLPSNSNGAVLNARLSAMPRQFIWSNTIGF